MSHIFVNIVYNIRTFSYTNHINRIIIRDEILIIEDSIKLSANIYFEKH